MRLENKVSLVTGASRGIGRAIALAYAAEGSDVVINCSSSIEAAEKVAEEVKALGRRALVVQADIAGKAAVEDMVGQTVKEFGKIDILVNNAGMGIVSPSIDLEESKWRRGIDVLLTGTFFCCQAAAREMIKQKSGKIVNISSMLGLTGIPERACYSSAKAGVIGLTRALAVEWAPYNINVNAICPGYVRTDIIKGLIARGLYEEKTLNTLTPLGRIGEPEDIASLALFLASEESKNMTGQAIVTDGGWTTYGYLPSWLEKARE